jgi:hypothetical protein
MSINRSSAGNWTTSLDDVGKSTGNNSGRYPDKMRQCNLTVERSWSNLAPNTALGVCLTLEPGGPLLCLGKNSQTSGPTGSGSDVRNGPDMDCGAGPRTYSLGSSACGLTATVGASCSTCDESEG